MRQDTALAPVRRSWWHDDGTTMVNTRSIVILIVVALTWAFSLIGLKPHPPLGLPSSVAAWSRTCPSCGTVESVATLMSAPGDVPGGAAVPFYRLTIRMADGSIRRVERAEPLAPGVQVLVRDGTLHPAPPAAAVPAPPQRQ